MESYVADESRRLHFLHACQVLDTEPEPAFEAATRMATRLFQVPFAVVSLVDERRQWFKSRLGLEFSETARDAGLCDHVVRSAQPLLVENAARDPRFAQHPLVAGPPHVRFYAGAPLRTASGLTLGTVAVMDDQPRERPPEALGMLELLAEQITAILEQRKALHERSQRDLQATRAVLRETETQYAAIVEASPNVIFRFRADGTVTFANDAFGRLFSRSRDELLGRRLLDIVAPTDAADLREMLDALAPDMQPHTHVQRLELPSGVRWCQCTIVALRDEQSGFQGYQAVATDISERVAAENRLREAQRFSRRVTDIMPCVLYVFDLELGRNTFTNTRVRSLLGYPERQAADLQGTLRPLMHPDDQALLPDHLAKLSRLQDDEVAEFEFRMRHADGSWRWFDSRNTVFARTAEGKVRQVIGTATDITGTRTAEMARRESDERFRQLAESINEVFWLKTASRDRILYVSPAYQRIWGRSAEALYRDAGDWLRAVHPEDRQRLLDRMSRDPQAHNSQVEYRIIRPDHTTRWIRDHIYPVLDDHGSITRMAGVAEDITEQRELEDQLRQTQKLESIGQLAAGVAHDFNNLLTVIQGNAALLEPHVAAQHEARELVDEVASAADRAASLTRQLLLFSRKERLQPRRIDPNEQISELSRLLSRVIGEHIRLELVFDPNAPEITADPAMLNQVITNLAINARDAMPDGGPLRIETALHQSADDQGDEPGGRRNRCLRISVADRGTGIPAGIRQRIFDPFFTTKGEGRGTGLGLATVYGIVSQHQGWIDVDSRIGEGSTFHVHLPAAPAPRATDAPRLHSPDTRGSERVLLVEDEPHLLDLLFRLLTDRGYTVVTAADGPEALERWAQHGAAFDLLVTDMVLPGGIRGSELIASCRRDRPELRTLLMSGYSEDLTSTDRLPTGRHAFLQKPFAPSTLLAQVRALLDRG